jgi:sugar phosphate isomerase/epimerase
MVDTPATPDRRTFLKTIGAAAVAAGAAPAATLLARSAAPPIRLGVDAYSLGAQNWTPFQTLDWAARSGVNLVHFSEVRFLGSPRWQEELAPDNLRRVREKADDLHIDLEIGMRSLCPSSVDFQNAQRQDPTLGTADEQIARMLAAAKAVRSPIVRCVQGVGQDRQTGIETHMADMVRVLKANRSRILDSGIKLAIENHAGDMQGRELQQVVEEAGPDIVGVCLDSGNPFLAVESPHVTLDHLAPYALTSHMRDSYVFTSPRGIASAWVRMGDGNMGMDDYIRTYVQRCPGKAVSLEVIVQGNYRVFNYRDPAAWANFKSTPAFEFAQLLALAEAGAPREQPPPAPNRGGSGTGGGAAAPAAGRGGPNPEAQARNLVDVEASVRWTQAAIARIAAGA